MSSAHSVYSRKDGAFSRMICCYKARHRDRDTSTTLNVHWQGPADHSYVGGGNIMVDDVQLKREWTTQRITAQDTGNKYFA